MRLRDLRARLIWKISPDGRSFRLTCRSLGKAQGVIFLCPRCYEKNGGEVGTHSVICWFRDRGVPDDMDPRPGRWTPSGTGIDDLTFVPPPSAVSVKLIGGCGWHGFVKDGEAK